MPLIEFRKIICFIFCFAFASSFCQNREEIERKLVEFTWKKDYKGGFAFLSSYADSGNACAQYHLGWFYALGLHERPPRDSTAMRWFLKSANQGYLPAQYEVSRRYMGEVFYGEGIEHNARKAEPWFRKLAAMQHVESIYKLIEWYESGGYLVKDQDSVIYWYKKAALAPVTSGCPSDTTIPRRKVDNQAMISSAALWLMNYYMRDDAKNLQESYIWALIYRENSLWGRYGDPENERIRKIEVCLTEQQIRSARKSAEQKLGRQLN